jgi:glyoxylase-like metal-dependent hydrolase (beta-lactamase superfamily II)
MLCDRMRILRPGDEYGNDTIVRFSLSSGRQILALATKNLYGGDWDFGPTWNYVVAAERPFLLDAGRRGTGLILMEMMEFGGIDAADLDSVVLSHGHEDHDGGLPALTQATGLTVKAHETYQSLIKVAPSLAPSPETAEYPATCWNCPMPESFANKHCIQYHRERATFTVKSIGQEDHDLGEGISVLHVPGHSPDCLAFVIDDEVMLSGDTLLPEITAHPTREQYFDRTKCVLPDCYTEAQQLYGLRAFIRSVKRLREVSRKLPDLEILPGHRLFSNNGWNLLNVGMRCEEMIRHHIQRCADILELVDSQPMSPEEIAREHFEPQLLKGFGFKLAINELLTHCELMEFSGDIAWVEGKVISTGNGDFESLIEQIQ